MSKDKINEKIKEKENCCCGESCECEDCNCDCTEDNCSCEDCCCDNDKNECSCTEEECRCSHDECDCESESCSCTDDKCCCEACDCNEEEILVLKNNIEHLEAKVKQVQAELINYRKRKDEEVSNMLKFANQNLIEEILPILDNFERALNMKSDNKELEKYNEGYKILYSHLVETIKKFGVEEIATLDHEFDPNLHEAVMIGQAEEKEDDIILEVFNKGYILKGRVIRPAKVRVNKLS